MVVRRLRAATVHVGNTIARYRSRDGLGVVAVVESALEWHWGRWRDHRHEMGEMRCGSLRENGSRVRGRRVSNERVWLFGGRFAVLARWT